MNLDYGDLLASLEEKKSRSGLEAPVTRMFLRKAPVSSVNLRKQPVSRSFLRSGPVMRARVP